MCSRKWGQHSALLDDVHSCRSTVVLHATHLVDQECACTHFGQTHPVTPSSESTTTLSINGALSRFPHIASSPVKSDQFPAQDELVAGVHPTGLCMWSVTSSLLRLAMVAAVLPKLQTAPSTPLLIFPPTVAAQFTLTTRRRGRKQKWDHGDRLDSPKGP